MVKSKNIKTKRPFKNLNYVLRGKFEIEKLCGTNPYRLKLLHLSGKIYSVFQVNLLEPKSQNTISERRLQTLPPVDLKQPEYVIKQIQTTKLKGGQVKYLVSWNKYVPEEDTWEPYKNLKDGGEHILRQFHLDNSHKLRDPEVLV